MAPSPMAEAGCSSSRRRFAVACSVLSQCVRAETAAAHSRPAVQPQAASASPMLLMPGADVVSDETVPTPTPAPAPASAKLTIVYGGRVLVFDDVRADRAAEVMRVAARQDMPGGLADLQVARKATLQRVMEKRRDRLRALAPYAPARAPAATAAVPKEQWEKDADKWLRLGIQG
ncbi:unnamed protein product [Miscanthus lutarioriparius]|uniref:Protein TIFY n=1 Tax=Miscanthus lutarioriparius TaxID=422564 RepID=A0A811MU93_9POAL|nr:unnamed protein product [Miscanthus lutarioriparius]